MKHPYHGFGRAFVFAGLLVALSLGIIGSCSLRAFPILQADVDSLDAKAQLHFDEARRNIPAVVDRLTETGTQCKLCLLMARDKIVGTSKTQDFLASFLKEPIIAPCRKGVNVYGLDFEDDNFLESLAEVNADYVNIKAYALGSLAIEAVFLKQTITALKTVLGTTITRLTAVCSGGAAFAAADGPFPFGDAVAVVLAAGGAAWSGYDLWKAQTQLHEELTVLLQTAIQNCQDACLREAFR